MRSFAFIFARGNSKGLIGKNIKLLNGKPLIEYSIQTALQTSGIDKVFVSTENSAIAKISKSAGAIVIDRPPELAQDNTPEWQAWKHAIRWANERFGDFEEFISLPATSPLRSAEDVKAAILKRSETKKDVCIAVTKASHNPHFNVVKILNDESVELVIKPKKSVFRRQDAPKVFYITTVVYVLDVKFIMKNNSLFDGTITSIEVPKHRAIDIDDIYDFNFVKSILDNS